MSYTILDIDNCIANDEHRIPKINWEQADPFWRYHDYHLLSAFDECGNRELFEGTDRKIIVLTARPVLYHAMTHEWLIRNGVNYSILMMRHNDDQRHSRDLKRRQLLDIWDKYGISTGEIECAYDDRADVVDMYRAFGVKAEVRSIHNTCAYTQPTKEATA